MSSAFPYRHIDKDAPQYQMRSRHVFVLQPPAEGAAAHEFVRFAQDLKSGLEAKSLSDSKLIPRSIFGGQELTLQSLKDEVTDITTNNPIEWIRGCVGIAVMYHPKRREKLISLFSKLPESAQAPGHKLLSISHGGSVFVFKARLHENRFIPVAGLYIWLDNPSDPAAEHVNPNGPSEVLTLTDVYKSKQAMEYFAMMSLIRALVASTETRTSDLKWRYEPLGNVFPDFEIIVSEQEWAVEVTRIESDMVAYLRVTEPLERDSFSKFAQKQVSDRGIKAALTKALEDKSKRRTECLHYSRACLLLVDVVDAIDAEESSVWNGIDFSAFDAIALIKLDGRVSYVKGAQTIESVN